MVSAIPKQPTPKSGTYQDEVSSFTDINTIYALFQPKRLRVSKNSPPVLDKDVTEGELVWDRTLSRIYTVSNGALKYVAFT